MSKLVTNAVGIAEGWIEAENEQELYKDIKRVAIALEKLVKLMTKLMKENG